MKPWMKRIRSAATIVGIGFALFLLAFLLLAVITNAAEALFSRDGDVNVYSGSRYVLLILTLLILPLVLRSRLPEPLKASYVTLPLMVGLVVLGITLHGKPSWMTLLSGGIVVTAALACLFALKKPWVYHFAVLFAALLALYAHLSGMQI